jgi:hypothetical protein
MAAESRITGEGAFHISGVTLILWLSAWIFLLRFPFFFPATIDWDESTFIIMGQGILDGLLPYQSIWDLKPPLAFVFYSAAIALFGKSIVAVRFAGFLWVVLFSWLLYRCCITASRDRIASAAAAAVGVTAASLWSPAVMTEIVCLVPLSGALLVSLRSHPTVMSAFVVGALLAISAMVRMNLVFVAILVGAQMVLDRSEERLGAVFAKIMSFGFGGLLVVAATALPFLLRGQLGLWLNSTFLVQMSFLETQHPLQRLPDLLRLAAGIEPGWNVDFSLLPLAGIVWIGILYGLWLCFRPAPGRPLIDPQQAHILLAYLTGGAASLVFAGAPHTHYLVQIVPVAAVLLAVAISLPPKWLGKRPAQVALACVLVFVSVAATHEPYRILVQRLAAKQALRYGAAYDVAEYLKRANPERRPIWMLSDHITYWLLEQYPPTRMSTHPSNVARSDLVRSVEGPFANCESEIDKIFAQEPAFVIKRDVEWYLELCPRGGEQVAEWLARDYRTDAVVAELQIYRRKAIRQ